jgi:2-polyprenyl-6-methoxyphenol hydroxylase-like FAD-dependent oxidoreductase
VADRFRISQAFLLGDAGHIHSPADGQGMNTGIADAVNLGWKLAHVLEQRAIPSVLDSYEVERTGFARSLVATTDRAFTQMVAPGVRGQVTRKILAPLVFSVAVRFAPSRHALFRMISQARIHYPESPLIKGKQDTCMAVTAFPGRATAGTTTLPLCVPWIGSYTSMAI